MDDAHESPGYSGMQLHDPLSTTTEPNSRMRRSGKILWREIEEVLSEDISNGVYPEGSRLPKEAELALCPG